MAEKLRLAETSRRMSSFQEPEDPEEAKIRELADDFNDGRPFDLSDHKKLFEQTNYLGYPKSLAIEASKVLGDKDLVAITEYIFLDEKEKATKYEKRKREMADIFRLGHTDMIDEIRRLKAELDREQRRTITLQEEDKAATTASNTDFYTEYIRALMADDNLSKDHLMKLEEYQGEKNITKKDHRDVLEKLEFTDVWTSLEKAAQSAQDTSGRRGDMCVFPCMHCIMPAQVPRNQGEGLLSCPVCNQPAEKIEHIYL